MVAKGRGPTAVHRSHHACYESVNAPRLFNERDESRNSAFVIVGVSEVRKDSLLERIDLILQSH